MDRCCVCGTELNKFSIIYAAAGKLYCSERCGISEHHGNFSDISEEVSTTDIGIVEEAEDNHE